MVPKNNKKKTDIELHPHIANCTDNTAQRQIFLMSYLCTVCWMCTVEMRTPSTSMVTGEPYRGVSRLPRGGSRSEDLTCVYSIL